MDASKKLATKYPVGGLTRALAKTKKQKKNNREDRKPQDSDEGKQVLANLFSDEGKQALANLFSGTESKGSTVQYTPVVSQSPKGDTTNKRKRKQVRGDGARKKPGSGGPGLSSPGDKTQPKKSFEKVAKKKKSLERVQGKVKSFDKVKGKGKKPVDGGPASEGPFGKRRAKKRSSTEDGDSKEVLEKVVTTEEGGEKTEPQKKRVKREESKQPGEAATPAQKRKRRRNRGHKVKRDLGEEDRTVFVGNIPVSWTSKNVEDLLKQYGKVEAVRLRSMAVADPTIPRKVSVIKKESHPERHNMNAYVRFAEKSAVESALKLNGTTVDGFVLRVDQAAFTEPDNNRCVFVGNLAYSAEEDEVRSHFEDCGQICNIRLIRDAQTGLGKGFGYVEFEKPESVELALKLNDSVLTGRNVRVSRSAKKKKRLRKRERKASKAGKKQGDGEAKRVKTEDTETTKIPRKQKDGKRKLKLKKKNKKSSKIN